MIISIDEFKKLLIDSGVIDEDTFESVYEEAKKLNIDILNILFSRRLLDKEYYANLIANYLKVKRFSIKNINIKPNILKLIPEKIALDKKVIPFDEKEDTISLAMANPLDYETINLISNLTHKKIDPFFALEEEIQYCLTFYQQLYYEQYEDLLKKEISQIDIENISDEAKNLSAIRIIPNLLSYATGLNASDIHIEYFLIIV